MNELLEYEASILIDIHHGNSLLVLAEGLGVDNVTCAILKLYSDPHNLLIILNYRLPEARFYTGLLEKYGVLHHPSIITAEVHNKEREDIYKKGGVVFVSSRILVVDLLMDRMPASLVSSVLLLRAHELQEASQDCFAIRLLQERNTNLCIKAISNNAVSLTSGYNHAERIMTQLCISELILWPRFSLQVISCLNQTQPHVEEVRVKLSSEMVICQSCILDLIKASLKEITIQNPLLNADELTLEKALLPNFDSLISFYIDPVWNQLSSTCRRLVGDITSLRLLLRLLIEGDAVQFLKYLEGLRQAALSSVNVHGLNDPVFNIGNRVSKACPFWFLMDQADRLLCSARSRVYKDFTNKIFKVELCPKWKTLVEVLKDVDRKLDSKSGAKWLKANEKLIFLILVGRESTARILERFLTRGFRSICRFLTENSELVGKMELKSKTSIHTSNDNKTSKRSRQKVTLTQMCKQTESNEQAADQCNLINEGINDDDDDNTSSSSDTEMKSDLPNVYTSVTSILANTEKENYLPVGCRQIRLGSRILSQIGSKTLANFVNIIVRVSPTVSGHEDSAFAGRCSLLDNPNQSDVVKSNGYRLGYTLDILKPTFVLLYEPRIGWVRELEVYNARCHFQSPTIDDSNIVIPTFSNEKKDEDNDECMLIRPLVIYFMLYENSVEEQRYLTTLRKEKEAFESLIKLKSTIVVPKDAFVPFPSAFGTNNSGQQPRVIVDMREFRSELPALLHRKGLKVEPMTLSTADYILAPHLCVERKSVSDLIGSLNSGRLYQQCKAMSRHYPNPILLIEFPMPNKVLRSTESTFHTNDAIGFSLYTGKHAINHSAELNSHHLLSKITLLTIHFPNLRLFWSITPYCTAELFAELKLGRSEPTPDKLPQDGEHLEDHNVEAVDMLMKLPGVSWKNYRRIMNNVDSLCDLVDCSLERLTEILDSSECANKLYNFLHKKFNINKGDESKDILDSAITQSKGLHYNAALGNRNSRLALAGRVKTRRGRGRGAKK